VSRIVAESWTPPPAGCGGASSPGSRGRSPADGEQQEGDADLARASTIPDSATSPHRSGRGWRGNQERRHDGQMEPPEEQRNRRGDRQDDGQVAKDQGQVGQRFSRRRVAGISLPARGRQ